MSKNLWFARQISAFAVLLSFFTVYFGIGAATLKAQELSQKGGLFEKYKKADDVTRAVRDRTKDFVRVKVGGPNDAQKIARLGKIVEDYGSFVIVAKDKTANFRAGNLEFQPLETSINLPHGNFEPVYETRQETVLGSKSVESGKGYYIVQFGANGDQPVANAFVP